MNDPLKDWDELQSQWQSYEPDIQQIKKKINWVTWRMGLILVLDIIIVLAYVPFLYFSITSDSRHWIVDIWDCVMGALLIYLVYLDFKIRLPIFRAQGESTREVLQLYIKRVEAGITIGRLGKAFCFFLLVLFIVWVTVNYFLPEKDLSLTKWPFLLFGVCWIGGFTAIFAWYQAKKTKELERLTILWKEYLD